MKSKFFDGDVIKKYGPLIGRNLISQYGVILLVYRDVFTFLYQNWVAEVKNEVRNFR